jgi:hypothetical protein
MNDMLPEEQDPQFEELITLLRQADLNPPLIDPTEHAQIISQARARLFSTDFATSKSEHMPISELSTPNTLGIKSRRQDKRLIHVVNMLAAVLVVAALIGSALLIFGPWSPSQQNHIGSAPPIGLVGAPLKVRDVTLDGFERSLKITPGPYFLGELLEVDLSITNHTHTDYWLTPEGFPCSLLRVMIIGGGSPHATDVQRSWNGLPKLLECNWPWSASISPMVVQLSVNQTTTIKQYVQLTSSGHITLVAMDNLRRTTNESGRNSTPDTDMVISLHLFVSPLVPSDRQLSLKEQKTLVIISGPPAVRGKLIGEWDTACTQSGRGVIGPGAISDVTVIAAPSPCIFKVTTLTIFDKRLWWAYVVGAPGYDLVSGRVNG